MNIENVVKQIALYRKKTKRENLHIYLVGGAVRDVIMEKKPKDKDYCISGLTQEELEALFPEAKLVGADFPVYLMDIDGDPETEVALVRKERKMGEGYGGFETYTDISLTILDDLYRRDLTINALAMNMETNEIIDPFNGKEDIKNGIIRAVSDAFAEDPLRVYRAARFAARYNFVISKETLRLMESLKDELSTLSGERIFLELTKVLSEKKPSIFFKSLQCANVLVEEFRFKGNQTEAHLKEVASFCQRDNKNYQRWLTRLDEMKTSDELERFGVFLSAFSSEEIEKMAKRIKIPKEHKQIGLFLAEKMDIIQNWENKSNSEHVLFATHVIGHPLTKQAESLHDSEPLSWFVDATLAVKPEVKEKIDIIYKVVKYLAKIKLTADEIKEKGIKGKEIGEYLMKKREKAMEEVI